MKEYIKNVMQHTVQNPLLYRSIEAVKPKRTIWSIFSVIFFIILPEIIAFVWGEQITTWAHEKTLTEVEEVGRKLYWLIENFFESGSFINLCIGILLLFWLVWDWKKENFLN